MTDADWNALTPRQREVATLVADGDSDKVIALKMGIGHGRVRNLISRVACNWHLDPTLNVRVQITRRVLCLESESTGPRLTA